MNTNIDNERFIRWQATTIKERGKTISLFLSLSLATIAFVVSQIIAEKFSFKSSFAKVSTCVGVSFLLACIGVMIFLTLNRLKDFNETMKIVKAKKENSESPEEIKKLESENIKTGTITRIWFNRSVVIFAIGEGLIILGLLVQLKEKLF